MVRQLVLVALLGPGAAVLVLLSGCARGGEGTTSGTQAVLDMWVQFAGPIDESAYYFMAIDADGDWGRDYPVPIASGPFWGNGWGTGSITHFVQYHLGRYEVYKTNLSGVVRVTGGGITGVTGTPTGGDAGRYIITIGALTRGAVTVSGSGMIQGVTNQADQNAGTLSVQTDSAGRIVAGSVTFTPAADGGRTLTAAEQAHFAALNAGGVPLTAESLVPLGLELSLGAPAAGSQTITVQPTIAAAEARFVPIAAGAARTFNATVRANSSTATATPPIPGASVITGDLIPGGKAEVDVEISANPRTLGPPFSYTLPAGTNSLRASVDLADLGANLDNLSINFIATTQLIFDPSITDPALNCYDGLGPQGNDAVTISAKEFGTYRNSGSLVPETANDNTLRGMVTDRQRKAVDIVDWVISLQRLR